MKGELDLARDKLEEALQLSEELSFISNIVNCLSGLGEIYRNQFFR